MQSKRKKQVSAVVAAVLVVAIALSGTYAWQSISQRARNEADGFANPGGRLHDDFNGQNKDIYVENLSLIHIWIKTWNSSTVRTRKRMGNRSSEYDRPSERDLSL